MNSIFEQLWNGNIKPYENSGRNDPEVEELAQFVIRNKNALDKLLQEEQKKTLEKYITCCDSYYYLLIVHAFRDGFSLAAKMLTEALRMDA